MDASLASILPNLSVPVVSILVLGFAVKYFTDRAERRETEYWKTTNETHERHIGQLDIRDARMREFEKEVRTNTMIQLNANSDLFKEIVYFMKSNKNGH